MQLKYSLSILSFSLLSIATFLFLSDKSNQDGNKIANAVSVPVPLPEAASFAGENVPLEHFDVRESLDRELQVTAFFHSQSVLYLKRSTRFLPQIEKILGEEGIPDDFKYLPFVESGYSNAVSPAGAAGYWQFLKGTAEEVGLEVNDEVDERYHLEKSTRAACKFLKESYQLYGSWSLAAASYNMGRRRLSEAIVKQKANNYFDLWLNEETSRYVFRIIAMKMMIENPTAFGFHLQESDYYPPMQSKTITIDSPILDMGEFAASNKVDYKIFRYYNPWLRAYQLKNPLKKTYTIQIPLSRE